MFRFVLSLCLLAVYSSAFTLKMGLDPVLTKAFPRDFKTIPFGTDYGKDKDAELNTALEQKRLKFLEDDLFDVLKAAVKEKQVIIIIIIILLFNINKLIYLASNVYNSINCW